jgi:hypothetical protein
MLALLAPTAAMAVDGGADADPPYDAPPNAQGDRRSTDAGDQLRALQERVRLLEEKLEDETKASEASRKDSEGVKQKVKELAEAIQFSGFFDVSASTYRDHPNVFALGSFEFDIKKEFGRYFQVGAALVFADKQADLAVGFIDFHLFGGLIPARGNVFLESGFHLQVGRFDVNIGNDWQYYASLDRPTMSAPLTTTVLMEGGYNDVGFRVLGNSGFVNYVGYVLKGATGEGIAVGGRLALVPFSNPYTLKLMEAQPLDVGFSYLQDMSQTGEVEQRSVAADIEARYDFLRLQSEYYWRRDHLHGLLRKGYQVSLFGSFMDDGPLPFGLSSRFDEVRTTPEDGFVDEADDEILRRVTLGAFLRPFEVTVFKLEFSHFFDGNETMHGNSGFVQLVIGFK